MRNAPRNTQDRYPVFMEDQREFFDELITAEWQTYRSRTWEHSRRFEVDRLFDYVSPQRIIDVGCGCGYHDILMAGKPSVEEVVGIDFSEKSIEVANREYAHPKVRRYAGNIFELPAGEYDLAVSFQVIEHLTDPVAFLRACARQVKSGGWVAAATPNRNRLLNRLLGLAGRPPVLADPQHFREYTSGEMRVLFAEAGLEFRATFAHGLSLVIPKLRREVIPQRIASRIGNIVPGVADMHCTIAIKSVPQ